MEYHVVGKMQFPFPFHNMGIIIMCKDVALIISQIAQILTTQNESYHKTVYETY